MVREGWAGLGRRQGRLSPGNRCAGPGSGHGAGVRGGAGQKETLGLRRGMSSGLWHQPRQGSRWVILGRSFSLCVSAHSPLKRRLTPSTTGMSKHVFPVCPSVDLLDSSHLFEDDEREVQGGLGPVPQPADGGGRLLAAGPTPGPVFISSFPKFLKMGGGW